MKSVDTWKYLLVCLAAAVLSVGLKNYLVFLLADTPLCSLLCPPVFDQRPFELPSALETLFAAQVWVAENLQAVYDQLVLRDHFRLFTSLLTAPVIEESLYRGPLYLTRAFAGTWIWRVSAVLLTLLFALSHEQSGLALLPLLVLGAASAWLIMKTGRFWPSLALHALYNFFFASTLLCPYLAVGD